MKRVFMLTEVKVNYISSRIWKITTKWTESIFERPIQNRILENETRK